MTVNGQTSVRNWCDTWLGFQIPIVLSQCLWCPGVIHAFWVVMKADTAADKPVVVVVNQSQAQPQQA